MNTQIRHLVNIRPDADTGCLLPVAPPAIIAPEGLHPVARLASGTLVLASDTTIDIGDQTFPLTGEPRALAAATDGSLTILEQYRAPRRLEPADDDTLADIGYMPDWNPVTIIAERTSALTAAIPAISLPAIPGTGTVTDADTLTRLARAVNRSYADVAALARRDGVLIRPVIARAIVADPEGTILYRGPEVLVGTDTDTPLNTTVTLDLDGQQPATLPTLVNIPAYRLRVIVNPMTQQGWIKRAATLTVSITPQFHPWLPDADTAALRAATVTPAVAAGGASSARRINVTLPGSALALSPLHPERSAALVAVAAGCFDTLAAVAAVIADPYDHSVDTTITAMPFSSLADEVSRLRAVITDTPAVSSADARAAALLNAPNRFTARHAATDGARTIVWADIDIHRFGGYSPADLAASVDLTAGYSALTTVTFRDGSTASRLTAATSGAPLTLSPLIVYPAVDAVALNITIEVDGSRPRIWRYDLSPDPTGTVAMAIHPSLAPLAGTVDDLAGVPASAPFTPPMRVPGLIAAADTSAPIHILAAAATPAPVRAVVPARSTSGAWDFGRARYHIFTTADILLATVNANRTAIALSLVATRDIRSPRAVAPSPEGITYAVDQGRIYRIDGARLSEVDPRTMRNVHIDSIAYDPADRRVVVAASSGETSLIHIDPDLRRPQYQTISPGPFNHFTSIDNDLYIASQSGLCRLNTTAPPSDDRPLAVEASIRLTLPARARGSIKSVTWPILSRYMTARLYAERNYLTFIANDALAVLNLNGPVTAPIHIPLPTRRLRTITLTLSATLPAVAPSTTPSTTADTFSTNPTGSNTSSADTPLPRLVIDLPTAS